MKSLTDPEPATVVDSSTASPSHPTGPARARRLQYVLVLGLATAAPTWTQTNLEEAVKLIPADGENHDWFGQRVDLSGGRALIGAAPSDISSNGKGAAYVFDRLPNGSWLESAKLTANDGASDDRFGQSVSLSSDLAAVGAPHHDANGKTDAGAAYIFERLGDGSWQEIFKVTAGDGAAFDEFGESVALLGDQLLVGAALDDGVGAKSGSVYVFERQQNGSWLQVAHLLPSDTAPDQRFGFSLSRSGDLALIGATNSTVAGLATGAAYVFERKTDGSWHQSKKLVPSKGDAQDRFGHSVSLHDELALIGSFGDDDLGESSGSAFVFEREGDGTWTQKQQLTASDGATGDAFGFGVAIQGDLAVIGSRMDDDVGISSGSAYLFERGAMGTWQEIDKLVASDGGKDEFFGNSVALSGGRALIGAHRTNDKGMESGSAYVFEMPLPLTSDVHQVSLPSGGVQMLALTAGAAFANKLYLLLGSFSGTAPGLPIDGFVLPLNHDAYLVHTLLEPNTPPLADSFGVLDGSGEGMASVTVPSGSSPGLAGTIHHAYVVLDFPIGPGDVIFVSNAAPLMLVP